MFYSFLAAAPADPSQAGGIGAMLLSMSPILLVFVAMYFIMIRPQKKKEKAATEMRNAIEVGDGVTTIGGIVGRVASIKEDTFVLETGTDRVKLRFKRWAIQDVEKLNLDAAASSTEEKK
ncbi:MAG: preprotein translocase subunit YajC [Oscillospiraceae bacterium]